MDDYCQQFINSLQQELQRYCQPLVDKFNATYFSHSRIYNNLERFWIMNRPDCAEAYFRDGMYNYSVIEKHPSMYQEGVLFWDNWEPSSIQVERVGAPSKDKFNMSHGVAIFEVHEDYCDAFEIAVSKEDTAATLNLAANLNYIHQFIADYKEKARKLIARADYHRFKIDYDSDNAFRPIEANQIITTHCQNNNHEVNLQQLTIREYECLAWMCRGKKSPEIAIILNISQRTVEKFVEKLKAKLGCYTLFQLGQFVGKNYLYFNPVFNCVA